MSNIDSNRRLLPGDALYLWDFPGVEDRIADPAIRGPDVERKDEFSSISTIAAERHSSGSCSKGMRWVGGDSDGF